MIQQHILKTCGRRFARVVADAQPGDTITTSLTYCHATTDEINTWLNRGWISDADSGVVVFNGIKNPTNEGQVA